MARLTKEERARTKRLLAELDAGKITDIEFEAVVQGGAANSFYQKFGPMLQKGEFKRAAEIFKGRPLLIEHGVHPEYGKTQYGTIRDSWVDEHSNLKARLGFNPNESADHRKFARDLLTKKLKAVSFGQSTPIYSDPEIGFVVEAIHLEEISAVDEPGCYESFIEELVCKREDGSEPDRIDFHSPTRDPSSWVYQYGESAAPKAQETGSGSSLDWKTAVDSGFSPSAAILASARIWGKVVATATATATAKPAATTTPEPVDLVKERGEMQQQQSAESLVIGTLANAAAGILKSSPQEVAGVMQHLDSSSPIEAGLQTQEQHAQQATDLVGTSLTNAFAPGNAELKAFFDELQAAATARGMSVQEYQADRERLARESEDRAAAERAAAEQREMERETANMRMLGDNIEKMVEVADAVYDAQGVAPENRITRDTSMMQDIFKKLRSGVSGGNVLTNAEKDAIMQLTAINASALSNPEIGERVAGIRLVHNATYNVTRESVAAALIAAGIDPKAVGLDSQAKPLLNAPSASAPAPAATPVAAATPAPAGASVSGSTPAPLRAMPVGASASGAAASSSSASRYAAPASLHTFAASARAGPTTVVASTLEQYKQENATFTVSSANDSGHARVLVPGLRGKNPLGGGPDGKIGLGVRAATDRNGTATSTWNDLLALKEQGIGASTFLAGMSTAALPAHITREMDAATRDEATQVFGKMKVGATFHPAFLAQLNKMREEECVVTDAHQSRAHPAYCEDGFSMPGACMWAEQNANQFLEPLRFMPEPNLDVEWDKLPESTKARLDKKRSRGMSRADRSMYEEDRQQLVDRADMVRESYPRAGPAHVRPTARMVPAMKMGRYQ